MHQLLVSRSVIKVLLEGFGKMSQKVKSFAAKPDA